MFDDVMAGRGGSTWRRRCMPPRYVCLCNPCSCLQRHLRTLFTFRCFCFNGSFTLAQWIGYQTFNLCNKLAVCTLLSPVRLVEGVIFCCCAFLFKPLIYQPAEQTFVKSRSYIRGWLLENASPSIISQGWNVRNFSSIFDPSCFWFALF